MSMTAIETPSTSRTSVPLFLLLAAVLLRCALLPDGYLTMDDLYTVTILRQESFSTAWAAKILTEPHPPLYNLLAYAWAGLFGDSIISLHSLSALMALAALVYIYRDGRHILPPSAYLMYLAFAALAPVSLRNFLEVRAYSLYFPAAALATLYFIALVNDRGKDCRYAFSYMIAALVTCFSHYFGMALIFFQVFYLALIAWKRRQLPGRRTLLLLAAPVLCSLIWFAFHVGQIKNNQMATTWIYPTGVKYSLGYLAMVFGMPVTRIGASHSSMGLWDIVSNPLHLMNVVGVCLPALLVLLLLVRKGKALTAKLATENSLRPGLLASLYMAAVPFLFFLIVGKILPVVNWKYMVGYIPAAWMFLVLLISGMEPEKKVCRLFVWSLALAVLLYFPGLKSIPRYQIGDALRFSQTTAQKTTIPLVLPELIEFKYFVDNSLEDIIIWQDIDKDYIHLPETFITVFGHCSPTEELTEALACVGPDKPLLARYQIDQIWKFASAGVYRFSLKKKDTPEIP